MICLYCEAPLANDRPQVCACEVEHRARPPIAGVNHVSQVLCALDDLRAGELDVEELEGIVEVFLGLFEAFEQKWRPGGVNLADRLTPTLQERFASALAGIDTAFREGAKAMDILQTLEADVSEEQLDQAEAALIAFFQGACGHAAVALDDFDSLKSQLRGSGAFFNLRSI